MPRHLLALALLVAGLFMLRAIRNQATIVKDADTIGENYCPRVEIKWEDCK